MCDSSFSIYLNKIYLKDFEWKRNEQQKLKVKVSIFLEFFFSTLSSLRAHRLPKRRVDKIRRMFRRY